MADIAVIGAGSVGKALGRGFAAHGHTVVFGVRDPGDPVHASLGPVATPSGAAARASIVVLAVPAAAVAELVPRLGLVAGQVLVDATNAVGVAVPQGFATMGDLVASLVADGVHVAKAFNTVGAEHLGDGRTEHGDTFLPVAGDPAAVDAVRALAAELGFAVAPLGGRDQFALVEAHAKLWIHLAFRAGWGRGFVFTVARP